jgi:hypothetical protein
LPGTRIISALTGGTARRMILASLRLRFLPGGIDAESNERGPSRSAVCH